ncbi:hypothetical protein ANANG_G00000610 [Anguilla anguilla]|uniref:TNFR-Cys domain-containing protein n=1 Tax=Anguilla anguilla TaxID=7936 RepID=A0A9D3MW63_ANGAN|nr:hypothetical protein ANANG_G00000610 [Anguilla anguilla]
MICFLLPLFGGLGMEATTMRYSKICRTDSYWNQQWMRCVRCEISFQKRAGYQFVPNCGRQDDGGQPAPMHEPCEEGTFNDGSFLTCRKCTLCPPGQPTLASCSTTMDTRCCEKGVIIHKECQRPETKTLTPTVVIPTEFYLESTSSTSSPSSTWSTSSLSSASFTYGWIAVVLLFPVLLLLLVLILKKAKCRRGGDPTEVKKNVSFLPPYKDKNVDELLAVRIQEAPLQSVLDNLDVLEELVMLLDPDSSVAKTTRHVATHCSFSATWINYAYSMRDTKSPLKAVLEAVTTKFPDWTVGHLARVFNDIGRNDAVVVLAKLPLLGYKHCHNSHNFNSRMSFF